MAETPYSINDAIDEVTGVPIPLKQHVLLLNRFVGVRLKIYREAHTRGETVGAEAPSSHNNLPIWDERAAEVPESPIVDCLAGELLWEPLHRAYVEGQHLGTVTYGDYLSRVARLLYYYICVLV